MVQVTHTKNISFLNIICIYFELTNGEAGVRVHGLYDLSTLVVDDPVGVDLGVALGVQHHGLVRPGQKTCSLAPPLFARGGRGDGVHWHRFHVKRVQRGTFSSVCGCERQKDAETLSGTHLKSVEKIMELLGQLSRWSATLSLS